MATVEELSARVAELERQLAECRKSQSHPKRDKIGEMSSEVVDSNPYR